MSKILKIFLIVLLTLSAILTIVFYAGGEDLNGDPKFTNLYILWAYILTGMAVGLALVFPIIQMITNPKNAKKGLMGMVALVVVIAIAYFMSSSELLGITDTALVQYDTPGTLRYAGMMINAVYLLSGLAILSMIYSEVSKAFK